MDDRGRIRSAATHHSGRAALVTMLLAWLPAQAQPQMVCGADSRSERFLCVKQVDLREDATGVRSAPLFDGGSRMVFPTGQVAHVDCRAQILYLTSGGRTYWRGRFDQSAIAAELGSGMCL